MRQRWVIPVILLGLVVWTPTGLSLVHAQGPLDIGVAPTVAPNSVPITGEYWALIIGIDRYQQAPDLATAVHDATAVREVLIDRYGFARERIIELLNEQATSPAIQDALYQLGQQAGPDDSVFIYYAGHGQYDDTGQLGWWVPTEANPKRPGTFIMDVSVLRYIKGMQAKHVYLVADSCFSGTLFGTRALPPINDQWFAKLYAKTSRWGFTSGGTEPVADLGKAGHSIFAYHFLTVLRENTDPYLVPSRIHDRTAPLVANNALQTPRSEPLRGAGDDGGQFVFRLAVPSGVGVPSSTAQGSGSGGGTSSAEMARVLAQLQALQKQMAEMNTPQPDPPPVVAKAQPYSAPQRMEREITGKDGAPMVLIPEGKFMMGSPGGKGDDDEHPAHQVYLDAFSMDQYEVTTSRYGGFMRTSGRDAPEYWQYAKQVGNREKPVIGVGWHDANAYCEHYGKRLPTEAEWEKAARGTDERTYPWGNDAPTRRHANFNQSGFKAYGVLTNVGSREAGKSPYGVYDMAGNVWEWAADWYDEEYYQQSSERNPQGPSSGEYRVLRGGSWLNKSTYLRSAIRDRYTPSNQFNDIGFRCAQDAP